MNKPSYVYAVRHKESGRLCPKCKGGVYYSRKNDALNKCGEGQVVVTFRLLELKEEENLGENK